MDRDDVFIYNGVDEVPYDVTHVSVDPSVTIIPERAFEERHQLVKVELPEGLVRIENNAFSYCHNFMRTNFPSTLTHIGKEAFIGCETLDEILLPEGLQTLLKEAFVNCTSLQRINIPPNLNVGTASFYDCNSLAEIVFSEGLREIGKDAFSSCRSLVSVKLPSSLKVIGVEAFEDCPLLNEIQLPNTLESIRARAFKKCNFSNFRIPPSIGNALDISIVGNNTSLVSLELPETVERLDDYHDEDVRCTDLSVRNIALPSDCVIDTGALHNSSDLRKVFSYTTISGALKHRFDDLPIHKICYYQSYHDNETTMQHLRREINPWTSNPPGQLNTTGKQQDCLGMTPLHILACSTKPSIEMYRLLIDKYPETLITKDKWGDIPLLYALWCNAPTEVIDLLVESYKSNHLDYKFNWKGMIQMLANRRVPLPNIQRLVSIHEKNFSDQCFDIQALVIELAEVKLFKSCTSIETFRYLFQISISKRLDLLDIAKWRIDLEKSIKRLPNFAINRDRKTIALYDRLATYESIKEGTSVLELAIWKTKIDEDRNKRARTDGEVSYRGQCRVSCGADIIIRNVLPYLLPK